MKIKFLSFSYTKPYSFNPIYYWLKSFYKKNGKYFDQYEWLPTEYLYDENIVDRIISEGTDILCLSVYLWNFESLMKVAKEVSDKDPSIHIIIGGPECHANTEPDWFERYPFIDFAVYGDGEKAFSDLLDWFAFPDEIDYRSIPNIVVSDYKSKHEILKFRDYNSYSPYLDLQEEFLEDYFGFKNKVNGAYVYLPYERTRGCMYSCAFCDWQGGLHYKVNTRINDYKEEIDFFSKHAIRTMQVDANVGMMKEDLPFYEYVFEKTKEHNLAYMPIEPRNMAKLHKDKVSVIYDLLCEASPNYNLKVSVQSIYDDVLANIERPDVPWPQHKEIIKKTKSKYPYVRIVPELIMGLPGLTFDRILETHLDFLDIPMTYLHSFEWVLLKKAPAYSKEYRDKHNLKVDKTFFPSIANPPIFSGTDTSMIRLEEFLEDPNIPVSKNQAYFIDMVYDGGPGIHGVIYNKLLTRTYNCFIERKSTSELKDYYLENNSRFLEISFKEAEKQSNYLNKYGFYLWGSIENEYIRSYEVALDRYIAND